MSDWQTIGVHAGADAPGLDTPVAGSIKITDGNTLEIQGQITGGTGRLYLLRKIWLSDPGPPIVPRAHFRFVPFRTYIGIEAGETDSAGYFLDPIRVSEGMIEEEFAIWNPSGALTLAAAPIVRSVMY